MEAILKNGVLALFVIIVQSQAAQASSVQDQGKLLFSQSETAVSEELDSSRGREGVDIFALNNMNVRATLTDNVANSNVSGYNIIDHGSFVQASGITDVVQNSGNNVIIQNATIVNVTISP